MSMTDRVYQQVKSSPMCSTPELAAALGVTSAEVAASV